LFQEVLRKTINEFKLIIHNDDKWKSTCINLNPSPPTIRGTIKINNCIYICKAVPLQAWSGPESSRKLMFPDFMITAQYGGKVVSLIHRPPLPTGNTPGAHFC